MATRPSVAIETIPVPERTIRVTVPAKVAYNLRSLQKVQAVVLERLGCPKCHSGFDIRFDQVRSFAADERLRIREI